MILHVVGGERFERSPERDVEFEDFFLERIRETNVDGVHQFEEESGTKAALQSVACGELDFESAAQRVSKHFHDQHVGASSDGAFFVFELSCGNADRKYYSLIKYDFREALEQEVVDNAPHLRRIVNALISDRKAVQKSAIVKVTNGVAFASVAARDRTKVPPDIGDYFSKFLDVQRSRSDAELTQAAVDAVREALGQCKEILPDKNVPVAFRRAKAALRDQSAISADSIVAAILAAADHPDDEVVRRRLEIAATRRIAANKLDGLEFSPSRTILRRPPYRRIRTIEGVTLEYPDDIANPVVQRQDGLNGTVFTIRTQEVREDRLVPNKTR